MLEQGRKIGRPQILALYLLNRTLAEDLVSLADIEILCYFSNVLEARGLRGFTDDTSLVEGQQIFVIDTQTYFPRYFEAREHEFKAKKFTDLSKPFFERYAGRSIFSVCRHGSSNTKLNLRRHHAFHIDVGKLIESVEFIERISASLQDGGSQSSHIVHLNKPADMRLATILRDSLDNAGGAKIIAATSFRDIRRRKDILRCLDDPDARVLFVDAMYISGQSTAQDFQQGLREGLSTLNKGRYEASIR